MNASSLHIVHGDGLLEKMQNLGLPGEIVVWRELLCEGKTLREVGSNSFIQNRKSFLKEHYSIPEELYENKFVEQLEKLVSFRKIKEINLWFEFDLYNHINMIALIDFLLENDFNAPVFLVCSRKLAGDGKEQKGLWRLSSRQLKNHFDQRINLTPEDLDYAALIWRRYCSFDHQKLIPEIKKPTNFEYLSSCMKAHLERFPNRKTGLNTLERNLLKLISKHQIRNPNQLLGYAIEYQGYYGYSLEQMQRIINQLHHFYTQKNGLYQMTDAGEAAFEGKQNFYQKMKSDLEFGGTGKYSFLYDPDTHRLMKL